MSNKASTRKRNSVREEVPEYAVEFEQVIGQGLGDIQNISCQGMKIKTIAKMALGAVALKFKLRGFKKRKTIPGEVVWKDEKNFSYGIKFWHSIYPECSP